MMKQMLFVGLLAGSWFMAGVSAGAGYPAWISVVWSCCGVSMVCVVLVGWRLDVRNAELKWRILNARKVEGRRD